MSREHPAEPRQCAIREVRERAIREVREVREVRTTGRPIAPVAKGPGTYGQALPGGVRRAPRPLPGRLTARRVLP
ncbi:hypothetical protein HHX38_12700 [Streptomyces sp. PKU-MA01144]|uniref:hypothetical protein n=1 Tax=Streptomyces sp. PKU-MA01144 TaxID=2729138 RepID=UPI00147D6DC8|nr:hypothetical protein [Streptomyces sp. PKU-MA01144]NNJ04993.1 hypothetical protein [Streptomyces sp. PKU-MA01144]